ncbi:MAG: RHS repeat-associated core domain-containing protein [Pyrinomonadaceae bacterium]|nr:RHS repeat-associated core domain-containing protein [Pyrinomonadaceae bacterium]
MLNVAKSFPRTENRSLLTRFQYPGNEKDKLIGLLYYRAPWYHGKVVRFISEDRSGFAGGDINLYGYVWNNPQSFTDPMGLSGGWGSSFADWSDEKIDYARDWWKSDPQHWVWNGSVDTAADLAAGFSDLFRARNGLGYALYCEDNAYGKAAAIAMDVGRSAGIAGVILGGTAGRVGAKPNSGAVKSSPSSPRNPSNGVNLKKDLASRQQMGEAGQPMAGHGTGTPFRDASRVANQYGGQVSDWYKMRSSSYTSSEVGGMQQFETHWVQNAKTGQRVEFKTKFPRLDR